jgi:uncharacterized membrane protein
MRSVSVGFLVFLFLLLAALVHAVCYYPFLPKEVASHFGPGGQPDDWTSKEALIGVYGVILTLVTILLLLVGLLLPKLPASMINLPNKKYWLAPERKAETCSTVSRYSFWFADATILLLIACMEITFRYNLGHMRHPNTWFPALIIAYVVFAVIWCVVLIRRFRRPARPDEGAAGNRHSRKAR